jgi:hypothetical protein
MVTTEVKTCVVEIMNSLYRGEGSPFPTHDEVVAGQEQLRRLLDIPHLSAEERDEVTDALQSVGRLAVNIEGLRAEYDRRQRRQRGPLRR